MDLQISTGLVRYQKLVAMPPILEVGTSAKKMKGFSSPQLKPFQNWLSDIGIFPFRRPTATNGIGKNLSLQQKSSHEIASVTTVKLTRAFEHRVNCSQKNLKQVEVEYVQAFCPFFLALHPK